MKMQIRIPDDLKPYQQFIDSFLKDENYLDPMLDSDGQLESNLYKAVERKDRFPLGVFDDEGKILGLFVFMEIKKEHYMEMMAGLCRNSQACGEVFSYLQKNRPGYMVDFVISPENEIMLSQLQAVKARIDQPQQKMIFTHCPVNVSADNVVPLTEKYMEQYIAMHNTDMYWTGDKVAQRPDRFTTLLAIENDEVVGYIDFTNCFDENEPYDLMVKKQYRRKGYGRQLLAKALHLNEPKDMMLLVETDNTAAINLYRSLGFEKVAGMDSVTVHWQIEKR